MECRLLHLQNAYSREEKHPRHWFCHRCRASHLTELNRSYKPNKKLLPNNRNQFCQSQHVVFIIWMDDTVLCLVMCWLICDSRKYKRAICFRFYSSGLFQHDAKSAMHWISQKDIFMFVVKIIRKTNLLAVEIIKTHSH